MSRRCGERWVKSFQALKGPSSTQEPIPGWWIATTHPSKNCRERENSQHNSVQNGGVRGTRFALRCWRAIEKTLGKNPLNHLKYVIREIVLPKTTISCSKYGLCAPDIIFSVAPGLRLYSPSIEIIAPISLSGESTKTAEIRWIVGLK